MPDVGSQEQIKLKVFISYSRKDEDFAEELLAVLKLAGFEPYLDKHDIAAGEDWGARLGRLIEAADTVVFVISPDAIASDRCLWEVERSVALEKRLLPIVWRRVDDASVPPQLKQLNYIFFDRPHSFGPSTVLLANALKTDLPWIREHTRLGEAAFRWNARGRAEALLLRGEELAAARAWVAAQPKYMPEPTLLHLEFIKAAEDSDALLRNIERQQLENLGKAQLERQAALDAMEAAQKERANTLTQLELAVRTSALLQFKLNRSSAFLLSAVFVTLLATSDLDADALRAQLVDFINLGLGAFAAAFFATFIFLKLPVAQRLTFNFARLMSGALAIGLFCCVQLVFGLIYATPQDTKAIALNSLLPWSIVPLSITAALYSLACEPELPKLPVPVRWQYLPVLIRDGVSVSLALCVAYGIAIALHAFADKELPPTIMVQLNRRHVLPIPINLPLQVFGFLFGALAAKRLRRMTRGKTFVTRSENPKV